MSSSSFKKKSYSISSVARKSEESKPKLSRASVLVTSATTSETSSSFTIPRKATIESDNKPHKVVIIQFKVKAKYSYTLVPKRSSHAYLKATIKNKEKKYPFLPGSVAVFMDSNYVANSEIPLISAGESFSVYLAVDPSIKLDYQTIKQMRDNIGVLKKSSRVAAHYNIVITNNKPREVNLNVLDALPKSQDGSIKVKLIEPDVNAENTVATLNEANIVEWEISLKANSKVELPFQYTVEYDLNRELNDIF